MRTCRHCEPLIKLAEREAMSFLDADRPDRPGWRHHRLPFPVSS